ncbi:MAG: ABC transporter permease [Actinobacteria bacterium]|nr:ABC transporter permease [Actinomycetota bacterium]
MRVATWQRFGPLAEWRSLRGLFTGLAALGLVVLVVLALTTDRFLSVENIKAILSSASIVGIMALGLTCITLIGSLVSLAIAATAVMGAMVFLVELNLGLVPALAISMAAGAAVTALQGLIIGAWGANPVILTIGAGFLLSGITTKASGGVIVQPTGGGWETLNSTPLGVPLGVYVMVALALLYQFVLKRTVLGRRVILIGENRDAARAAGMRIPRITAIAFAIAGASFALGGAFLGAFNKGASAQLEGTATFDVIAAVLVGGTLISGGRGSALRTLAGAIVIATISDLLLLRGFDTGAQILLKGVLVVVVVLATWVASGREGTA